MKGAMIMTDHAQRDDQANDPKRPSQAEGDRATVEQSLRKQPDKTQAESCGSSSESTRADDPERPSQAEGERDGVEERPGKQG